MRPSDAVVADGLVVTLLWDDASVAEVVRSDGFLERLGEGGVHLSIRPDHRVQPDLSRARRVPPPAGSLIAGSFAGADLLDAYAIALPPDASDDVSLLARAVLGDPAIWFRGLIRVRDAAVARLGVKTSHQLRTEADATGSERIDFFSVRARAEHELVIGEDDRHLDFRASILSGPGRKDPRWNSSPLRRCIVTMASAGPISV